MRICTWFSMPVLSFVETSPWVWPVFSSLSWLSALSLEYTSLCAACKTRYTQNENVDFLDRTVSLYLAATISPDVRFHKLGCVERLSLVSFIQVPWDSILFKSIPVKNEDNYYIFDNIHKDLWEQGLLVPISRNVNDVPVCAPAKPCTCRNKIIVQTSA